MPAPFIDFAAHLRIEQEHLLKADTDIDRGRQRLVEQQHRLARLRADGHDWRQASQLVELLSQTLDEWERHRVLILQRLDYLQRQLVDHDH